jgi:hypothetical protein
MEGRGIFFRKPDWPAKKIISSTSNKPAQKMAPRFIGGLFIARLDSYKIAGHLHTLQMNQSPF